MTPFELLVAGMLAVWALSLLLAGLLILRVVIVEILRVRRERLRDTWLVDQVREIRRDPQRMSTARLN